MTTATTGTSTTLGLSVATWLWGRRTRVWRSAAGLALLFFFSRFMLSLSGAALWLPPSMRHVATALGMLVGFAAVRYGRVSQQLVEARPSKRVRAAHVRRNAVAALVMGLVSAGLFAAFAFLMQLAIVQWDPPAWFVDDYALKTGGTKGLSEHLRLEVDGDTVRSTVFVPLWYSADTQQSLDLRSSSGNPVVNLLDTTPEEFLSWLEGRDALWVAWTIALVFVLYLGVLVFAAFAWGCGYSALEELATEALVS